jgi:malate/lactate dehydrogenase
MSRSGKVTVVGAGFYGSTTALRLAEYDIFETVLINLDLLRVLKPRLLDKLPTLKAPDMKRLPTLML